MSERLLMAPAPPPLDINERQWQCLITDLAGFLGWFVWHDEDSRKNIAGLPDLLLIRERVIWRELKTERGRLREAQIIVGDRMIAAGADWKVWRPSMWHEVVETLR